MRLPFIGLEVEVEDIAGSHCEFRITRLVISTLPQEIFRLDFLPSRKAGDSTVLRLGIAPLTLGRDIDRGDHVRISEPCRERS
jgi:hypothetical protein